MDLFEKCLDETRRKFDNMLICGDLNLPKVPWDCPDSWIAANERCFVDVLNDHFLIQHNGFLTWGNNVLDLVISSIPDQVSVTEVLEPNEAEMFIDHCIVSFDSPLLLRRHQNSGALSMIMLEEILTGSFFISIRELVQCNIHWRPWYT